MRGERVLGDQGVAIAWSRRRASARWPRFCQYRHIATRDGYVSASPAVARSGSPDVVDARATGPAALLVTREERRGVLREREEGGRSAARPPRVPALGQPLGGELADRVSIRNRVASSTSSARMRLWSTSIRVRTSTPSSSSGGPRPRRCQLAAADEDRHPAGARSPGRAGRNSRRSRHAASAGAQAGPRPRREHASWCSRREGWHRDRASPGRGEPIASGMPSRPRFTTAGAFVRDGKSPDEDRRAMAGRTAS